MGGYLIRARLLPFGDILLTLGGMNINNIVELNKFVGPYQSEYSVQFWSLIVLKNVLCSARWPKSALRFNHPLGKGVFRVGQFRYHRCYQGSFFGRFLYHKIKRYFDIIYYFVKYQEILIIFLNAKVPQYCLAITVLK